MRLANGSNTLNGFPQVLHNNQWIKICTQGNTTNNLRVICGHKGYYFSAAIRQTTLDNSASMGYQIHCNGSEKYVQHCWHAVVNIDQSPNNCSENIQVFCTGTVDDNFF